MATYVDTVNHRLYVDGQEAFSVSYEIYGQKNARTLGGDMLATTAGGVLRRVWTFSFQMMDDDFHSDIRTLYEWAHGDTKTVGLTINTPTGTWVTTAIGRFISPIKITTVEEGLYDVSFQMERVY
jgi:hypothetical protein